MSKTIDEILLDFKRQIQGKSSGHGIEQTKHDIEQLLLGEDAPQDRPVKKIRFDKTTVGNAVNIAVNSTNELWGEHIRNKLRGK